MRVKERVRLKVFVRVGAGAMTLKAASALLGLGYRQTKRSWARYREEADVGRVRRLRGKASNQQVDAGKAGESVKAFRRKVLGLWSHVGHGMYGNRRRPPGPGGDATPLVAVGRIVVVQTSAEGAPSPSSSQEAVWRTSADGGFAP